MKVYQYHTDDLKLIMKKTSKGIIFFFCILHTKPNRSMREGMHVSATSDTGTSIISR